MHLKNLSLGAILLTLVASLSGCGPGVPEKDEATLKKETVELDKKILDEESKSKN